MVNFFGSKIYFSQPIDPKILFSCIFLLTLRTPLSKRAPNVQENTFQHGRWSVFGPSGASGFAPEEGGFIFGGDFNVLRGKLYWGHIWRDLEVRFSGSCRPQIPPWNPINEPRSAVWFVSHDGVPPMA